MNIGKTFYARRREDWRAWLLKNHKIEPEIWLIYPHKNTGRRRIPYNDAVEEALCVGWIDSIVKKYNSNSSVQRFSPRKNNSNWSQPNIERLAWLSKHNLLLPEVKKLVAHIINKPYIFPEDIIAEIKKNKVAWRNYRQFSPSYKRIRIAYIDIARDRTTEFKKRLKNFIVKTQENKPIGYGGIEKYY